MQHENATHKNVKHENSATREKCKMKRVKYEKGEIWKKVQHEMNAARRKWDMK